MSQIARVQVHEFTYEADNIGVDRVDSISCKCPVRAAR